MKTYSTIQEMFDARVDDEIIAETNGYLYGHSYELNEPLLNLIGGVVRLVENRHDLSSFLIDDDKSIMETYGKVDVAHFLLSGRFATLCKVTNDAGGDLYYVPYPVVDQVHNIYMTIKASGDTLFRSSRGPVSLVHRPSLVSGRTAMRRVPLSAEMLLRYEQDKGTYPLTQAEIDFIEYGTVEEERSYVAEIIA